MRGREEEKGKEGAEPGSRAGSRRGRNLSVQPARGERRPPRRRRRRRQRRGRAGGGADACSWAAARGAERRWRAARGDAGLGAGLLNPLGSTAGLELGGGASAPRTRCPTGPHYKLLQTEASRLPGPNTSRCPFAAATPGVPKAPRQDLRLPGLPTRQPDCSAPPPLAPVRLRPAVGFIELDFSPPQPHHLQPLSPVSPPPPQFPPPRPSFPPSSPSPGHFANLWLL